MDHVITCNVAFMHLFSSFDNKFFSRIKLLNCKGSKHKTKILIQILLYAWLEAFVFIACYYDVSNR